MSVTTDNNLGNFRVKEEHLENFSQIDRKKISDLAIDGNSDLLIFPDSLQEYGDKIGDSSIFELKDDQLTTGNIMGFVGVNGSELKIRSRFAKQGREDYFLHYMLEKVFAINLFDLKHSSETEDIFDFILFLFPHFLKKAYRHGVFKEYQHKKYNDANVKGRINIHTHIKKNLPFAGNVAYQVREYSYDNYITQLIRHTIEHIAEKSFGFQILNSDEDTRSIVSEVIRLTPSYNKRDRRQILYKNIRPVVHPYYTAYKDLQKICKRILNYENIKFGTSKDEIYGVLFDGAWLWEEYLHSFLTPLNLVHPENKSRKDRIHLFSNDKGYRYPDFYNDKMVLDAKYKRLKDDKVGRDDLHQIITYMYVRKAEVGGFICPVESNVKGASIHTKVGKLHGYGGEIHVWRLPIPEETGAYVDFRYRIQEKERELIQKIREVETILV